MEDHIHRRRSSGSFLAWLLIIVGVLFLLKHSGWDINLPGIGGVFRGIGEIIGGVVHFIAKIGWPIFLIIAGIILLTGRRIFGLFILIMVLLFILPHFILIPGILVIVFFPVILVIAGIIILTKLL